MYIDTHSHLNFKDFDNDRDEVIKRTLASGVFLINIGSDYESSKKAVEIATQYGKGVLAGVGLHPGDNKKEIFDFQKYKDLAQNKKVVAIGEFGLDFLNIDEQDKFRQKALAKQQFDLAKELNLPVILHCRKAHNELIKMLGTQEIKGVVHCFTGTWQQAQKYMALGLYLGFNGIIFKMNIEETIKRMPLEKMVLETDCPFLTPPQAQTKRNEPANVKYIAQKIADARGESLEKIAQITTENAKKLFKI